MSYGLQTLCTPRSQTVPLGGDASPFKVSTVLDPKFKHGSQRLELPSARFAIARAFQSVRQSGFRSPLKWPNRTRFECFSPPQSFTMGCCIGARTSQAEDMSPFAASNFDSPLAAQRDEEQVDQPSTLSAERGTEAKTEAHLGTVALSGLIGPAKQNPLQARRRETTGSSSQDMSPFAASNFDSPLAAQTEEVQMDPSTPRAERGTRAKTEADVDPGEIEVLEASLRQYFLNHYKGGGAFEHEAYEHDAAEWCWIHKRSGIKVWQDALDLTQASLPVCQGPSSCLLRLRAIDGAVMQTLFSSPLPRNLAGKLLNEPGQPERQLRCRADATAERLGPEHHKALLALSRLADVLRKRGAFAEAEPLRRRDLEAMERQLGPEHRETLAAVNNLAVVLQDLGQLSEAPYLRRAAGSGCGGWCAGLCGG
eukprot:s1011_g29.t2